MVGGSKLCIEALSLTPQTAYSYTPHPTHVERRPRTKDLRGTMGYLGHGNRPQVSGIGQNKAVFQLPPKRATSAGWLRAKIYVKSLELIFSGWKPAGS